MEEYKLSKIFWDVYSDLLAVNPKKCYKNLKVDDYERLENDLTIYLNYVLGYKLDNDYTQYFREIRKYFENIIVNAEIKECSDINQFILDYAQQFFEEIDKRPLSSIFIHTLKSVYASDFAGSIIGHYGKSYTIERVNRKEEEGMPATIIKDIDNLEYTLSLFVEEVEKSESYFKSFFDYMDRDEAVSYLFEWVVKNATASDMTNIEQYFKKYTDYITDDTFNAFKRPVKIGNLLGDELYIMRKKANVNYETPYYLSFMMKNGERYIELPTVRMGMENTGQKKVAHILATQTSQINTNFERYNEVTTCFKKMLSKSKNFREFNPSHVISIILTLGILKGMGIDKVKVEEYFPLRLQRLILEERKNDDELYDLQHRLTDKNIYNYFRLMEFFDGVEVSEYPDNGSGLILSLNDNIKSDNAFLQNLYNIGYRLGVSTINCIEEQYKAK